MVGSEVKDPDGTYPLYWYESNPKIVCSDQARVVGTKVGQEKSGKGPPVTRRQTDTASC